MLNRAVAPDFKPIEKVTLPNISYHQLQNDLPVYYAGYSTQDVFKIELVFEAGTKYTHHKALATLLPKMMQGGTSTKNASQIQEAFDSFGGFPEISQTVDFLTISVLGLKKYAEKYIALLIEILSDCIFPTDEIATQKDIAKQNLILNLEQPSFLANRKFRNLLLGKQNPYGIYYEPEDIDALDQAILSDFYTSYIKGKSFKIFLSGNIQNLQLSLLDQYFGKENYSPISPIETAITPLEILTEVHPIENAMQSTIRLGKVLFGRKHPDYYAFLVTNTILGGYFGSRLMSNIREDKGFTYGISSSLVPVADKGYWVVGSDVKVEHTTDTLNEIFKEITTLQNHPVEFDEFTKVINYMSGSFAGSVNNAFEVMDRHKNSILNNLPADFYDTYISKIREVNPADVSRIAQTYFDQGSFTKVIVGGQI